MKNVNAHNDIFHAQQNVKGVQFIYGQSVSAFKSLIKSAECSAVELMIETLNDAMYDSAILAE